MQVTYPRCLGALAAAWTLRTWMWPGAWASPELYIAVTLGLALGAAGLMFARPSWQLVSSLAVVGGGVGYLLNDLDISNSPVVLLCWAGVIVAGTVDHPHERALLLRVCVTCVYGFTALAKVNPSFLAGDQMVRIATTRDHMAWSLDLMAGPVGILMAVFAVLTEFTLAAGLWWRRTRRATALVGVGLHTVLVVVATTTWDRGVLFLLVLNFGLVAMYPAFWHPIRPRPLAAPAAAPRADSGAWTSASIPISS